MTHSNFIVARLSDVDFNRILQDSLATIANQALEEKWTDEGLKTALSRHMTGLAICRDSVKGQLDSELTDCCKLL